MRLPIIGGSYQGRSRDINAQRTINWYPEFDAQDAKTPASLIGTPGLELHYTLPTGPHRGAIRWGDDLYWVSGQKVYKNQTEIGTLTTNSGRCDMDHSFNELMIVDGAAGYIYNKSGDWQRINSEFFPENPVTCEYMDGYFAATFDGSPLWAHSDLNDGLTWLPTDFAEAEGDPDPILNIVWERREAFIFGTQSVEVWYNAGQPDDPAASPFVRIQGGFIEKGCAARFSVAKCDNSIMWLSQDDRGSRMVVRLGDGYNPVVISTPQISYRMAQYETVDDAFAFSYQQEGHEFYVLTFPSADATWVYDALTQQWHERSTWTGQHSRWRPASHVELGGKHYVGDFQNGKVYRMDMDVYDDAGDPIVRDRISAHLNQEDERIFLREIYLRFEEGVGLTTGQGSDPQAMLRWSKDGGYKFGNELWRSVGKKGEYRNRAVWRNPGMARDWVFWLRVSDPVKWVLVDAQGKPRNA